MALVGIVQAAQWARDWAPHLKTEAEHNLLGWLVAFTDKDGEVSATAPQLAEVTGYHRKSISRVLHRLEESGAIVRTGDRPVFGAKGVPKGGRVPVWSIVPVQPNRVVVASATQSGGSGTVPVQPGEAPSATPQRSHGNPKGYPLRVEKLREEEICAPHTFEEKRSGPKVYLFCSKCNKKGTPTDALAADVRITEDGDASAFDGRNA